MYVSNGSARTIAHRAVSVVSPILTLKGAVGSEVSLTFGVYDTEDEFSVDFGDGELQTAKVGLDNKGPVQEDGSTPTATTFTGTVAGDGTITVYGNNDIWYYNTSGDVTGLAQLRALFFISGYFLEIKTLLKGLNFLFGSLTATLVAAGTLERRILYLGIELDLRLCT